jgi:uncharacterized protein (DUF433 family)
MAGTAALLTAPVEQIPLRLDPHGVARVGTSRVTLETLVNVYHQGATAEAIAERFPTLTLADIYAVLGYYLRHRTEVDDYLRQQDREAEAARRHYEQRFGRSKTREQLAALRRHKRSAGA